MSVNLDCVYYFNSRIHPPPPAPVPCWIDLAADPSAAHDLMRLGISPRKDLPAVLFSEAGGKLRVLALALTSEEASRLVTIGQPNEGVGSWNGGGGGDGEVVLYGSTWCPDCRRAKRLLDEAEVPYREVNVDEDPKAEALILERSGGRRVVPTLLLADRLFAFNPDPPLLRRLLDRSAAVAS